MPIRFLALLFFFAACAFITIQAQDSTSPSDASDTDSDARTALEQQTFYLINQYRKDHQLPLLEWNGAIAKLARAHSRDMATGEVDFGHGGFNDRVSQLKSTLVGLRGAGENVFESDLTEQMAQLAVTSWLHSPHHLKNIRGDYNFSGLGVWQNKNGTVYMTQIFVKTQPPAPQTQSAAEPAVLTPFGYLATPTTR